MYRLSLVLTPLVLAGLLVPNVRGDEKPALRQLLALEEAFKEVIKQAEPSVACILVSRSDAYSKLFHDSPPADSPGKLGAFDPSKGASSNRVPPADNEVPPQNRKYDLADANAVPEAFGSGVVIDGQELLVLTTYHVVREATKIYVRLPGGKGSYADIHAADPRSDLAVLRLLNTNLRPLKTIKLGDGSRAEKGQFVISLANPFAAGFRDGSASASWGILSNIHRPASAWPWEEEEKVNPQALAQSLYLHATLLQTDAPLNLGTSGGALLNLRGEMIGLTTARAAVSGSETAGGFAVPVDPAIKRIINKLREGVEVEYGFLGVQKGEGENGPHRGEACIGMPIQGSPADKAGLQVGDVIESINGIRLSSYNDLYLTVATLGAGEEARLLVRGREKLVKVTLAKSRVLGKIIVSKKPAAVRGIRVDYTSVLFQQRVDRIRGAFAGREPIIQRGVYVSEIQPDSRAAPLLKVNDVITHIKAGGTDVAVNTPQEFYREAARIGPNEPLELTLSSGDWQRSASPKVTIP